MFADPSKIQCSMTNPVKQQTNGSFHLHSKTSVLPTNEKPNSSNVSSPQIAEKLSQYENFDPKPESKAIFSNYDVRYGPADSTVFHDTFEESRASSIASINQIAEALRRKSLMAEPKLAIEHLLSIGKR